MAIYGKARQRLIVPGSSDPRITITQGILHVDAGDSESLFDYFNGRSGGVESHFHSPKVKQLEQYRDTAYEADANHLANPRAMSVETQGLAHEEWNDKQLDDIKGLMLWGDRIHNIPLRKCPTWDAPGWGYHVMFGTPGWWTPSVKSCPGPKRIEQFHDILLPWMEEEEMAFTDEDRRELAAIREELAAVRVQLRKQNASNLSRFRRLRDLVIARTGV
jgi:hypothetical protein